MQGGAPGWDVRSSPGLAAISEEVHMIFQQFLYPQTGCAAYVFG